MNAKEFLQKEINWEERSTGMFDRNSLAGLLERYADHKNKKLQHYHDTTVGLWATDRPKLVDDPRTIMFQIEKAL